MARYMVLWEVDTCRTPEDPKTKKAQLLGFQDLVRKQIKAGIFKEWGAFAGGMCGYLITEGNAVALDSIIMGWVPFVKFTTKEIMTIEQVNKATKALPE